MDNLSPQMPPVINGDVGSSPPVLNAGGLNEGPKSNSAHSGHDQDSRNPQSRGRAHICSSDDEHVRDFPRVSRPVELMKNSYDCVVIGSGYGGSIAASRMARAGQSVCVLERGREKWPGEYPVGAVEAVEELHFSGDLAPGYRKGKLVEGGGPTGMFHLVFGKGQNAFVCNGLGGTSLINANVFLEADKDTLAMDIWPPEIREDVDSMDKYYRKVRDVLEPEQYPADWPKLPKLELLQKQAESLGLGDRFRRVEQTTRFHNGPNSCGVEMAPSTLTGQDCTGINDGSKTTTLVTYLADAWNWNAEIFCETEVRHIEKAKDENGKERPGYIVCFAWHGRKRGNFKTNIYGDLMWAYAKHAVFLGAGAIGSTEILLRSNSIGLKTSDLVGQNMSGNGDILSFGYNTKQQADAMGRPYPSPSSPIGPTIDGIIDCRSGHENPLDGFVIEEGAVPQALAHVLQMMLDLMPGSIPPSDQSLMERTQAALARYGSRFLGPYFKRGALEKTQIYLIMSHDSNQAVLSLQGDQPVLEFIGVGRSAHVKHLNELLAKATHAVGGTLVQNPFYAIMGQQEITVHPIGGACMARDNTGATGVVNHAGEVFKGTGSETWDGLIVTDGAVIPAALGANPFATISALAERSVEHYAKKRGLVIREDKNGILDLLGEPEHLPNPYQDRMESSDALSVQRAADIIHKAEAEKADGIGFTEVMSGFVHYDPDVTEDSRETYERASRRGESLCEGARFFLSAQSFNTKHLVDDSRHRAMLSGTFVCSAIHGSPFMVRRGEFDLFTVDHTTPGTCNLTYDFDMYGVNGRRLHFHGYKVVDSSVVLAPLQLWRSTTTLYVTISDPEVERGICEHPDDKEHWRHLKPLAKGIMHVQATDFASEISTLMPTGRGLLGLTTSAFDFANFFIRRSLSLFLTPFKALQYPTQSYKGYINNTPPTQSIAIEAADDVFTRMHIWEPTSIPDGDPKNIRNLFMIPGAAVDHQIFALPTIPFNAVNYFCRAGYRVFVTVHRICMLKVAENNWTTYDARLDIKACLDHIRQHYGTDPIYTIAHCMGSVAFSTGLLDGTIPASWVKGITCSQVFMNPIWTAGNMAKIKLPPYPPESLYRLLAGSWFGCATSPNDTLLQRVLNQILRFWPDSRRELCDSATCHRISLVFGRCWDHHNLNEVTHRQIDRFFGGVNMTLEHLLMKQGAAGHVMSNAPRYNDLTVPENVGRLRGIPFLLWVGRDNAVLSPEATERTYEILCDAFGGEETTYKRRVVPDYGHLDGWMGKNAWKDVYPFVREEVDRVTRSEGYVFVEPDDKWKRMVENGELIN